MTDYLEDKLGHLTDKFSLGYYPFYRDLLAGKPQAAILEIGIAYGGSLRLWHEMVPEGRITGVNNIDVPDWPYWAQKVIADQADPALPDKLGHQAFDLIVDDASHMGSKSATTFSLLWPLVKPGGWYVLEDWTVGLPDNPYFPVCEGNSMFRLARSFTEKILPDRDLLDMGGVSIPAGAPGAVTEVHYRYGLAMVRKTEREA